MVKFTKCWKLDDKFIGKNMDGKIYKIMKIG